MNDMPDGLRKGLENKAYVDSIEQAKKTIAKATEPTMIEFKPLYLGAEDKPKLNQLIGMIKDNNEDIYVSYDEADLLETKKERTDRAVSSMKLFRKTN